MATLSKTVRTLVDLPDPVFVVEAPKPPKALGCWAALFWPKPLLPNPVPPKDMMAEL